MSVCYILLFFLGFRWTTDGAITFSKTPKSPAYFKVGSDAVLEWKYPQAIETTELKSVTLAAKNKTTSDRYVLLVDSLNGAVVQNPNIISMYRGRVKKIDQATFVIKNVTFDDSRSFVCLLKSKLDFNVEVPSIVELVVTGDAVVDPPIRSLPEGGSANFTCTAVGVPSQNVSWARCRQSQKMSMGSPVLKLRDVSTDDTGCYTCDATVNENQTNTAFVYLQVMYPPRQDFKSCPKVSYTVTINDELTICCPVSAYPPPFVTWEKNGTQLQKDENTSYYTIADVKEGDLGNYTCIASTADGKSTTGPFTISVSVMTTRSEIRVKKRDGTDSTPAVLEWQSQAGAEYYVVETEENIDTRVHRVMGSQSSLEIHYNTLVMKENRKPDQVSLCAKVSAFNGVGIIGESPQCQQLKIQKPSDVEN